MTDDSRALLGTLPKPVVLLSGRLDFLYANPAFSEMLGLPGQEPRAAARTLRETAPLIEALTRAIPKLPAVGRSVQVRWPAAPARVFDVHVTRTGAEEYLAMFDEVSRYLHLEEIQTRARSHLESVLNHLETGIIVLDADLNTVYFNAAQGALFDRLGAGDLPRSVFEILGGPIAETYPLLDPEEWEAIRVKVVWAGEIASFARIGFPRADPTDYFTLRIAPLAGAEDRSPGAVCITDDVTRTVALGREIDGPLTTILGTVDALLSAGGLSPLQASRVDTIGQQALRAAAPARRLALPE